MLNVKTQTLVINALVFQLVWFICVQGNNLSAVLSCIAALIIYKVLIRPEREEVKLLCFITVLGLLGDNLIMNIGLVSYAGSLSVGSLSFSPPWLIALWIAFSTTLFHSLKWVVTNQWLCLLLGVFVVPFSYWAGIKLSGSILPQGDTKYLFFLIEGLLWANILCYASLKYKQEDLVACTPS